MCNKGHKGLNVWVGLGLLLSLQLSWAQGTLTVLDTGGGQPLISRTNTVSVSSSLLQPRLEFNFGFGTAETPQPETFLDSFTVSIQDTQTQTNFAVYLTIDASGLVLAPPTEGALAIDPTTITVTDSTIGYPEGLATLANRSAYHISAAIPSQLVGGDINVFFDLFDNQTVASQGWFSDLQVVPEPQAWALLVLGMGSWCWIKRRRRLWEPTQRIGKRL